MTTLLLRDALTETYDDVHGLIRDTVYKFIRVNGNRYGDFDELLAHANMEFMTAWRDYKRPDGNRSGNSSFSSWCRWVVQKGLLEHQRKVLYRDRKCRVSVVDMTDDVRQVDRMFNLFDFTEAMSTDAAFVVKLTVDTPNDLTAIMREIKGNPERVFRETLRQYLLGYGWSPCRIDKAFDEVTEALK